MLTAAGGGGYWRPERVTEWGRRIEREKVKYRSDFRSFSADKHEGRQLQQRWVSHTGEMINPLSSWLSQRYARLKSCTIHTHTKIQAVHPEHTWCHVCRECPSQTLLSLCLFLYILACQSQAEGVRGLEYGRGCRLPGQQPHHGDSSESCRCFLLPYCFFPPFSSPLPAYRSVVLH